MSLTRKALVAMGIEAEKIDQIIEMHSETVEALKTERDDAKKEAKQYKGDSEKLAEVQKELKDLKDAGTTDKYEEKYNNLKAEYDKYKGEMKAKETKSTKETAYKKLLKECGVSEKRYAAILRLADLDSIDFDDAGNVKDADKIKDSIKEEWGDYIETTGEAGAKTATPPENKGGKKTKEDILAIKDSTERQAAIAENHELFGF